MSEVVKKVVFDACSESWTLCKICERILRPGNEEANFTPEPGWNERIRGRSSQSLEAGSAAGCPLCLQVFKYLDGDERARSILFHERSQGMVFKIFWDDTISKFTKISILFDLIDPEYYIDQHFDLCTEIKVRTAGDMQERNNTIQVVAQCRKWISNCFGKHEVCRLRVGAIENWLPTRLLDTGSPSEPPSVRLAISTNLNAAKTSYLALSHCWGKLEIKILRLSTLDEFQEGISLAALPRTFQHAVVMTRALGYRYLWIDSLCIIQDSFEDWQYEATLMGEVYGQADCVLAATGSKDGDGGLFQEREPQLFAPFEIDAKFRFHKQTYSCIRRNFWERELANAPLNQRGWVVQERMLSPRTLQFGKNQIFWQCREVEACETLPKEIPQDFIYFGDREGDRFKRWMQPDSGARSIALGPYDPWGHVVKSILGLY